MQGCHTSHLRCWQFGPYTILKGAAVKYEHDLDAHSVQTFDFEFPTFNVPWKWFLPVTLDSFDVDQRSIDTSAASVAGPLTLKLNELLGENKVDEALKTWSSVAEKHILQHCKDDYGTVPRGKRFIGRSFRFPHLLFLSGRFKSKPDDFRHYVDCWVPCSLVPFSAAKLLNFGMLLCVVTLVSLSFSLDGIDRDLVLCFWFVFCFWLCCFCLLLCLVVVLFWFSLLHDLSHRHLLHTKDVKFFTCLSERALDLL